MSLRLMSAAWAANLPSTPKLVLLALADNANDEGNCAPSIKTIMGKCSLSERAVFTNITLLEKGGFLLRQNRQFKSNVYTITPPNTWQTERAKPSKQRQKQAENHAETAHMGAFGAPPALNAPPAPGAPTNITIKSKPIGLCAGDASTREVHANAWVRDAVVDTLPGWVDREAFFEFREHRRAIKKPLTPQSEKIALKTLFDVFNNGESQREIIERSILNGWAGLFANSKKNSSGNKPAFNAFNYLVEKNRGAGNERDITNECE